MTRNLETEISKLWKARRRRSSFPLFLSGEVARDLTVTARYVSSMLASSPATNQDFARDKKSFSAFFLV
jgi:hypothetical protein